MMEIIRKLGKIEKTQSAYAEAEEAIMMMTIEEARSNKKLLIYIYKWVISQKEWTQP